MRKVLIGGAAALALATGGGWWLWSRGAATVEAGVDDEVAALKSRGIDVTWGAREIGGFPFGYVLTLRDVTWRSQDGAVELRAPWSRTEAAFPDPGVARTTLAPEARLTVVPPADTGLGPIGFALISQDLAVESPLTDTAVHALKAGSLSLRAVEGWPAGALEITLADVAGSGRRASPEGFVSELTAARLDAVVDAPDPTGRVLRTEATAERVALNVSGLLPDAPGLAGFLAGDGRAELRMTASSTVSRNESLVAESGASMVDLRFGRDGLTYSARVDGGVYRFTGAPVGAPKGVVEFGPVTTAVAFPAEPRPAAQRWGFEIAAARVALDDTLWASADPLGALTREPFAADVSLAGDVRVLKPLDGLAIDGEPPVALETIDVRRFAVSGLGAAADVSGALKLVEGQEAPDGALSVTVHGWQPLLDALARLGVVGPDQAAMARLMAAQFGRPDAGEGVFAAEIEMSGGRATVNGQPLQ